MRDFSRAFNKLHGIATNLDWFIVLLIDRRSNITLVFVLWHSIENRSRETENGAETVEHRI